MNLIDKLFTIDGGQIVDMSSSFKDKAEKIFYEAVEDRVNEESYLDGIEDVLENMKKHGMKETADIVERNLLTDGFIEDSGDADTDEGEQDKKTDESMYYADIVAGMIG